MEFVTYVWDALEGANLWLRGLVDVFVTAADQFNVSLRGFLGV